MFSQFSANIVASSAAIVVAVVLLLPQAEAARAFFVFGDSLVDNGNNNYLITTARADSPPYGIDYPTHRPTGRFSNGYNIPDLISQALGAESTLAYLSPELNGEKLLVGANFASAGIGILNDTGIQFANIIRIAQQLELFAQYQQRLGALIGADQAEQRVNQALVLITLGGNDYVNNYFLTPVSARRLQYNIQDYSVLLISEYRKILLRLYELGARRVLVTGTGPIGCVPAVLATRSRNGECAEEPQQAAATFNPLLIQMIQGLNQDLGSDVFVAVNAMQMQNDFITNPQDFGFITSKIACCGQGAFNGVGLCTAASNLCPDRNVYAFWDPFHPSERANKIIVQTILFTHQNEHSMELDSHEPQHYHGSGFKDLVILQSSLPFDRVACFTSPRCTNYFYYFCFKCSSAACFCVTIILIYCIFFW